MNTGLKICSCAVAPACLHFGVPSGGVEVNTQDARVVEAAQQSLIPMEIGEPKTCPAAALTGQFEAIDEAISGMPDEAAGERASDVLEAVRHIDEAPGVGMSDEAIRERGRFSGAPEAVGQSQGDSALHSTVVPQTLALVDANFGVLNDGQSQDMQFHQIQEMVEQFIDPQAIKSVADYAARSFEEVVNEFFAKNEKFIEHREELRYISDAHTYSISLKKMEELAKSLQNIQESAESRDLQERDQEILPALKSMATTRADEVRKALAAMPLGSSTLLLSDLDRLKKVSEVATESTYESQTGRFYEPQVSQMGLTGFFGGLKRERGYTSITVGWKVSKMFGRELGRMCTYVAFQKSKESVTASLKSKQSGTSFPSNFIDVSTPARRVSNKEEDHGNGIWPSLLYHYDQLRSKGASTSSGSSSSSTGVLKPSAGQRAQLSASDRESYADAVERIVPNLREKADQWNFAAYKVFSSDKAAEYFCISPQEAAKYEYIIFYHKPAP